MRQVVSLSLPANKNTAVKTLASKRGFNSVSGYIQYLIELDQDLISAEELLVSVKEAEKEYKTGKTVTAKSLADLL